MTLYPHFAFPNLYLLNGYREFETHDGLEFEYEQEDGLEQCIRRLLVRKPTRLQGWDLRFLRRGLGLSQAEVGAQIDRDAQTVARWEKSADSIPSAIDLAIRTRFAAEFEPQLSTQEILNFVDGRSEKLPSAIYLRLTNNGWKYEPQPKVKFARSKAYGEARVLVAANAGLIYKLSNFPFHGSSEPVDIVAISKGETLLVESKFPSLTKALSKGYAFVGEMELPAAVAKTVLKEPSQVKTQQLNVDIKGTAHEKASATIH